MATGFDSFNARNLRAQDIARTFVESDDFQRVCKNCHSIVLGPRGSGKTTLLKMLTAPAVESWRERIDKNFILPFSSIYIPTDIVWHHQLLYSKFVSTAEEEFLKRASRGAVVTSIMSSVIETFIDKLRLDCAGFADRESELAEHLITGWNLSPAIPKLSHIYLVLKRRTIELGFLVNRVRSQIEKPDHAKLPDWCDLGFVECTDLAITAFDSVCGQDRESRWAMCFDELELAPTWLQEILFKLPRSTNQKLLFKLSSSPDPEVFSAVHVKPSDDVDLIKLWRSSMVQRRSFCRDLVASVLGRIGLGTISPEELFGHSDEDDIEGSGEAQLKPYVEGSQEWHLIKEVAGWDASFAKLLVSKGIDPSNPTVETTGEKDSILRKVKPVAALRKKFAKVGPAGKLVRRSRKSGGAYSGVPALYDISDGNPRRLIRICEDMCQQARLEDKASVSHIPRELQARVILKVAYLYRDYLKMIPGAQVKILGGKSYVELYTFLREIGRYFSSGLLLGPFPLDPKSSFTVDEDVDDQLIELLRLASYHGAIVKTDASEAGFTGEIRGCRFRLCYTLSPLLQLPLRLYEPIALSTCLKNKRRLERVIGEASKQQLQLPISDESA